MKDFDRAALGTLFYQPSTRTRLSFISAAQRLGAQVLGFASPNSTRAGDYYRESLDDVVGFTSQYADALVLRHYERVVRSGLPP